MTGLFQDVKFGLRMMAQSPWFTFVAVLTLALGIGVNSVGFSIANGVWWKKLPFQEPREIVSIGMSDGRRPPDQASLSFPEFADIRSGVRSFKSLAALGQVSFALSNEGNVSERYSGLHVTSNMFSFLGIQPVRGRDFNPEDEKPGAPKVLLIAHDLWQSRFGGSEDVVGRSVRVDGTPATIVGVMPAGFRFLFGQRVWVPLVPSDAQRANYSGRNLVVFGRLHAGVGIQEARLETNAIAQAIASEHPDSNKGQNAVVLPFLNWVNGPEQNSSVYLLVIAVAFVLLIACGNVANLLLSRAAQRSREISVRTALGASRWRIIRQVQMPADSFAILVRGGDVGSTVLQLRKAIAAMDSDLALYHVTPTDEMLRNAFWAERFLGNLFTLFAAMALVMSSIGLYGVTAHGVNQRTREIGIRAALGATPFGVIWLVVKQSLTPIAAGLAIGLLGAVLLDDFLKQIPFAGAEPGDPVTFISILILLAAVTLAASFLPAWRASKLNPAEALRTE